MVADAKIGHEQNERDDCSIHSNLRYHRQPNAGQVPQKARLVSDIALFFLSVRIFRERGT
jgi:hypothetical protein